MPASSTVSHVKIGRALLRRAPTLSLFLTALVAVAVTTGSELPRAESGADTPSPPPLPVATFVPEAVDGYLVTRWYLGRLEAARSSALGFELAGQLDAIEVHEGDQVAAGQLLATLDALRLQAQRNELEAAVAEAEARRRLAQLTLNRLSNVVQAGGVSRQQLDEAREGLRVAEAAASLARARVDTIGVEIAKSQLRAPFDGVIVRRLMDEGRVVAAGEPILELLEGAAPEVRVGVPTELAEELPPGSLHTLRIAGEEMAAQVLAVIPAVDPRTRTLEVRLVPHSGNAMALRDGALASVGLQQWVSQRGYWVPLEALTEGMRGTWNVYEVAPAEAHPETWEIRPRPVETLHLAADRAFVAGDLAGAYRLVASGLHRTVPGQQVRPTDGWVQAGGSS